MSNFVCPRCGMVNIDCGKEGYKTPKELEYEKALEEIKKVLSHCVMTGAIVKILYIINKAKE